MDGRCAARRGADDDVDLVVVSHLRWPWVWQRPQHLVTRLAPGRRTWFVEEPVATPRTDRPRLGHETHGDVERVWLEVPGPAESSLAFGGAETGAYLDLLQELLGQRARDVWLYSSMALDLAEGLAPRLLVYDVMDDLASFAGAPAGLALRHRRLLSEADVVFTGGRSLHAGVVQLRGTERTYRFASGVECDHYDAARRQRRPRSRPVAGYVGVVDERLDLGLLADLADELPDWDITVVGPVAKIDRASLPDRATIRYLGQQPYERLPELMAGFDVALMPFALNEATRSISPTKTLEYLAAGLPVVSTRVPDVVADWSEVVHLADDGPGFAAACRHVLTHSLADRDARTAVLRASHEWDHIAAEMQRLLDDALALRVASARRGTA